MLNIELTPKQVRSLKWQVAGFYRHAKDFDGSLSAASVYLATNTRFDAVATYGFIALGVITGYGYRRGDPAGGSFLSNWRRFLAEHVTVVAPPSSPPAQPGRPGLNRLEDWKFMGKTYPAYSINGSELDVKYCRTPKEIVALLRVVPDLGARLHIDTSVQPGSAAFWALVDRANLFLADWETTSKVAKDYEFYR